MMALLVASLVAIFLMMGASITGLGMGVRIVLSIAFGIAIMLVSRRSGRI